MRLCQQAKDFFDRGHLFTARAIKEKGKSLQKNKTKWDKAAENWPKIAKMYKIKSKKGERSNGEDTAAWVKEAK